METKNKVKASETSLDQVLDQVIKSDEPVLVLSEDKSFVVVSEDDWNGLQETLYLQSIPGYTEKFLGSLNSAPETWVSARDVEF